MREEKEEYLKEKYKTDIYEKKMVDKLDLAEDNALQKCLDSDLKYQEERQDKTGKELDNEEGFEQPKENTIEEDNIATKQFSESQVNTKLNIIRNDKK